MVVLKEMLLTSIACASVIPSYLVILLVYVPRSLHPYITCTLGGFRLRAKFTTSDFFHPKMSPELEGHPAYVFSTPSL